MAQGYRLLYLRFIFPEVPFISFDLTLALSIATCLFSLNSAGHRCIDSSSLSTLLQYKPTDTTMALIFMPLMGMG